MITMKRKNWRKKVLLSTLSILKSLNILKTLSTHHL